jgi:hypothetical protein
MRLFGLSPVAQQRAAVLVPVVALVLSLFVVYPAWGRYGELQTKIEKQQAELRGLRSYALPKPGPVKPTVDWMPSEPPQFFGYVSALAQSAGCRMVGYDIVPTQKTSAEGPIRALRAKVELEAEYPQIRTFLARLAEADRLFVVTEMTVGKPKTTGPAAAIGPAGTVQASVEIERYVSAAATPKSPGSPGT